MYICRLMQLVPRFLSLNLLNIIIAIVVYRLWRLNAGACLNLISAQRVELNLHVRDTRFLIIVIIIIITQPR